MAPSSMVTPPISILPSENCDSALVFGSSFGLFFCRSIKSCQLATPALFFARFRCKRSEEHTSELQSLMRISYAVFCLKKKIKHIESTNTNKHYTIPTEISTKIDNINKL